ncbi:GNAT family N-acetyltransferase [Actinomadura madurae]|uniref:hypothetical protein n=1 Tax=Actinomadura madurae TaxID=1993 RepID=UPI0039994BC3
MAEPVLSVTVVDQVEPITAGFTEGPASHPHVAGELLRVERLYAAQGGEVRYVVATDRGGRLRGLLPVYPVPRRSGSAVDPAELFGPVGARWEQAVCLGSLGTLPNAVTACGPDRVEVLRALFERGVELAAADGADFVCVPQLEDEIAPAVAAVLPARSIARSTSCDAIVDVTFTSFDGYVASLPARRRQFRRERRRFAASPLRLFEVPLVDAVRELAPLLHNVERKYGSRDALEVHEIYLLTTGLAMRSSSTTLVACRGRTPVAFSVIWEQGPDWSVRCWGCDYELTSGTCAYFNLVFYEPLIRAAERGVRSVNFGTEALEPKRQRGARLRRLTTLGAAADSWTVRRASAVTG